MRLEIPKGLTVSADMDESTWTHPLRAHGHQAAALPQRRSAAVGEGGRAPYRDNADRRRRPHLVRGSGDRRPDRRRACPMAHPPPRRRRATSSKASLPATAHGLAIAPKSDDVDGHHRGRARGRLHGGRAQTSLDPQPRPSAPKAAANPAFIDFAGWGKARGKDVYARTAPRPREKPPRRGRSCHAAGRRGRARSRPLLSSATAQAHEALGVLKVAGADRPDLEAGSGLRRHARRRQLYGPPSQACRGRSCQGPVARRCLRRPRGAP